MEPIRTKSLTKYQSYYYDCKHVSPSQAVSSSDNSLITNDADEVLAENMVTSSLTIATLATANEGIYSCRLSETLDTEVSEQSVNLDVFGSYS